MKKSAAKPAVVQSAYQPLVIVASAACGGIVLDRIAPLPLVYWTLAALIAWLGWCGLWRLGRSDWAVVPLMLALTCTAGAWHHCRWWLYSPNDIGLLAREEGGPAALEVRATRGARRIPAPPPDAMRTIATPERTRIDVEVLAVRDGETWRPISGTSTLNIDGHLLDVRAGDRLRVFAQLGSVRRPGNPGEFDYAQHARVNRRLCWLSSEFPECVTTLSFGSRWNPSQALDHLRSVGDSLLWRNLDRRRSGLASAMFLGSREELEPDQTQAYMETGTIHLLVISGLNVGILASCLFLAMRAALVPQRWALAIVVLASSLYAVTTDAQPPVVRATVMVLIVCAATILGRRSLGYNAIAAAALVVLALNPAELFQHGTQLSFLSVLVLAWVSRQNLFQRSQDPLDRLIAGTRPWHERFVREFARGMGRAVLVSLLIWIVICPLVMARFHLISPVAIVLGPVLSIPVAIAMGAGFGIFVFGWLLPIVAVPLAWICDVNLSFMEASVTWARSWPGNHAWVGGPGNWWLVGFYTALACWAFVPSWTPPRRWCLALLAGWSAVGFSTALLAHRAADRLECTFLSVGHGSAVVLELPGGQTLLYDAGRLGSPTSASRAVAGYLWSRGITRLDAVVISHADADHYNALPALLEQFAVGVVYVSPVMFEGSTGSLAELRTAIERAGVPLREVWSGDRLRTRGDTQLEVLHPPRQGVLGSDNANSIVLAVEFQNRRLLLTGDLESPGLDDVIAEVPYDCDVLLTPHHGSPNSDPPGFADWSTPEWTVVSGGQRDRLETVTAAYTSRGSQVLHTSTSGAVHVAIDNGRLAVDCWHGGAERGH